MPVHAGAALCCTAAPEADGDRGEESKEIKGLQGGVHVLRRMMADSDFDRRALTCLRRWKRNIKWKELPCPPPHPLWRAASLELGWDMQMQPICPPAPSEAAELRAASCTHPPHLCGET